MKFGVIRFPGSCDEVDAVRACERVPGASAQLLWHGDPDLHGVEGRLHGPRQRGRSGPQGPPVLDPGPDRTAAREERGWGLNRIIRYLTQPEPTHCVSTGNQPVNTPSGCSKTFAIAVCAFEDVTVAILGWARLPRATFWLAARTSKKPSKRLSSRCSRNR